MNCVLKCMCRSKETKAGKGMWVDWRAGLESKEGGASALKAGNC